MLTARRESVTTAASEMHRIPTLSRRPEPAMTSRDAPSEQAKRTRRAGARERRGCIAAANLLSRHQSLKCVDPPVVGNARRVYPDRTMVQGSKCRAIRSPCDCRASTDDLVYADLHSHTHRRSSDGAAFRATRTRTATQH